MSENKRIARNTIFLYIRMFIILVVSLYTSRIVLDKLGVDDFGLYSVVGGVVGMLSFINGTLSIGTMRFITTELGRNDSLGLEKTFNTAFYTHLGLSFTLVLILETFGLWFVYNELFIPPDRLHAAVVVYHISVVTSIVSITQVPYESLIMAHERMNIYAYISIFEAIAKLGIVYLLYVVEYDRLIFYTILCAIVSLVTASFYRLYCRFHFSESKLYLCFDISIFKSLMGFSGWNIIANLTETLKLQGYIVLINLFFQPYVVAAQAIANQVAGTLMQFVINFRTAINPQIIKLYASGEYQESKSLTLSTMVLTFDLILLICLPLLFILNVVMDIWLVEVPAYAVVFCQYVIVQKILSVFDAALYIPMMAANRIKTNSVYAIIFGPGTFFVLYVIFKLGGGVMWLQYIGVLVMCIFSFYIKPSILVKEVEGYQYADFYPCYLQCAKVASLSVGVSFGAYWLLGNEQLLSSILLFLVSFTSVLFASYIFLESPMKNKIRVMVFNHIKNIFYGNN